MAAKKTTASEAQDVGLGGYERIPVEDLHFDSQNPRLVEYFEGEKPTQEVLLQVLWEQMAVDEIAMSIAASGYFAYEPVFVSEEKGRLVVIEGNRRLAAVKLLLDSDLRKKLRATDLPAISPRSTQSRFVARDSHRPEGSVEVPRLQAR